MCSMFCSSSAVLCRFLFCFRERRFMDTWLGKLRAGLAAEYGFYYRLPEAEQWQCIGQDLDLSWKDVVRPIMQYFTERTPGTYIENKESRQGKKRKPRSGV